MKPNISIGSAAEEPVETGQVNPSTAEQQSAEDIVHLKLPSKIWQPARGKMD